MTTTALPTHTEVAIVGAGPTGLALAVTLASAGIEFVIVDQLAEGANTSRAAVVHARTLEVLDELGAADALIARGDQVTRFAVRDGSRRLLTVPFDGLPTPYPYTLMVPQCETEAVLLARLRALGRDVHRPYQVSSVVQDEDGVTLTMSTGQTLRAGYAVGADGMHSAVREAAGNRVHRQRVRRVLRPRRRHDGLGPRPRRSHPDVRLGRSHRRRPAPRRALPHRRHRRRRPGHTRPRLRPAPARRARPRPGQDHRVWPGPPGSGSTTGSPTTTGPAACCSPATPPTCTARPVVRA